MIHYLIALNGVNKRRVNEALNHVRAEAQFEILHCKDMSALNKLPKRDYCYFMIGMSGAVSPEQLANWLGARISLRTPKNGPVILFDGDVARQEDYRQVVRGHFGVLEGAPRLLIINGPDEETLNMTLTFPYLRGAETYVCSSLAALRKLPKGFYANILVGEDATISAHELAKWMDGAIPKHLHYQVNMMAVGGDLSFMNLPRRHTPRQW